MTRTLAWTALPRVGFDLVRSIARWQSLARQRRALARLDARALEDIGLTFDEAKREAQRKFWDAPQHWGL